MCAHHIVRLQLFQRGGDAARALDLCFRGRLFDDLRAIAVCRCHSAAVARGLCTNSVWLGRLGGRDVAWCAGQVCPILHRQRTIREGMGSLPRSMLFVVINVLCDVVGCVIVDHREAIRGCGGALRGKQGGRLTLAVSTCAPKISFFLKKKKSYAV